MDKLTPAQVRIVEFLLERNHRYRSVSETRREKNKAMRKVLYGPEGIMLSHIMKLYDKQSLLNYASDLQIRRVSGLKKDELAERRRGATSYE